MTLVQCVMCSTMSGLVYVTGEIQVILCLECLKGMMRLLYAKKPN